MSEEELNEAIEYNLEYMEAMQSEEIFGGDYTSSVELEYANKTIDRLQQRIDKVLDFINAWKKEKVFKVSMLDLMQIEEWLKGDTNDKTNKGSE